MSFVAEVVYGLKRDYGRPMTFWHDDKSFTPESGENNPTSTHFDVQYLIPLSLDIRQGFFKAINLQRQAYLQPGEQQFVLDMSDIPGGFDVIVGDYLIDQFSTKFDIGTIEKIYDEAMIITCTQV